jgi:hypothetical protein
LKRHDPPTTSAFPPAAALADGHNNKKTDKMIRAPLLAIVLAFATEAAIAQAGPIEFHGLAETPAPRPIPRTADGHPDFSGNWDHAFITTTGRMRGAKSLVVSSAEAKAISDMMVEWAHSDAAGVLIDPDFFVANVTDLLRVDGEWRTSLITSPGDGVQHYTDLGKRLESAYVTRRDGTPNDPEERPLFERCLVGVGSAPLTPIPARMIRQFVQTADHLVISSEGNDVRIVGLNALPRPAGVVSLLGDSTAHWEGDTLVVHTTGISGQIHTQMITRPESRIIERFRMKGPDELFYQFTVEDTEIYAEPFSAEFVMQRTSTPVLEYACHEGNYSIVNILQAGRVADQKAKTKALAAKPSKDRRS